MTFSDIYERIEHIEPHTALTRGRLVDLLQRTWANMAPAHCESVLRGRRPFESAISASDLVRVELLPDDVRCAVYSAVSMWDKTSDKYLVREWYDLTLDEQNSLLIEAFPDGDVYGV